MNILILDSWLREFVDTNASPDQISEALSLHSASVEAITKESNDYIYDIEITTNRVDMASTYGIAREVTASLNCKKIRAALKPYKTVPMNMRNLPTDYIHEKITNLKLIPRFTTILVNTEIKNSPAWLKDKLNKSGINSINNVVDITNYVMLEIGQPMHAFDYDKIAGHTLMVRESMRREPITVLDGTQIELKKGSIVIADKNRELIDLCGIMGGLNSAIDQNTRNVLFFAQKYDPIRIRKTTQETNIRTHAATLFEKGTDPELTVTALRKAFELLKMTAQANIKGGLIDLYPQPYQPKKITLNLKNLKKISGVDISTNQITRSLKSLGFKISPIINYQLPVTIPSWRREDIKIEEDIIEEIVRLYGYQNIPANLPPLNKIPDDPLSLSVYWQNIIKNSLVNSGYNETYSYSLMSTESLNKYDSKIKKYIKLLNPLNEDMEILRPSLIPSLLDVIYKNQSREADINIFELAKIYLEPTNKSDIPIQPLKLSVASNRQNPLKLKETLELLLANLGIENYKFEQLEPQKAKLIINKTYVGSIFKLDDKIRQKFNINNHISIIDLDFNKLIKYAHKFKKYKPVSHFPPIIEDITLTITQKTHIGPVIDQIKKQSSLITNVDYIDSYKNNHSFRVTFQSTQKSLSSNDVKEIRKKIKQNA